MIPTIVPDGSKPRYIFLLTVVAALILVVGALTRPRNEPPAPTSDADLALISRLSERRSLENMTAYFSDIASAAELSLVRLRGLPTSALAWDADRLVAARVADPFPSSATFDTPNGDMTAMVTLRRPDRPVVIVAAPPAAALVPVRRSSVPVQSGAWVVASWAGEQPHTFAYGSVLDITASHCGDAAVDELVPTFRLTASMAGGGLFDIDGYLLGVIVPCAGRMMAISADSLDTMLSGDDSIDSRLLSRFGMRAGTPTGDEAAYARITNGLIVREVWLGYTAHAADVRPGDVILSIDDTAVAGADDRQRLIDRPDQAPPRLTLERGSARIDVILEPAEAPDGTEEMPAARGVTLAPADGGRVEAVAPGSPAAAAGIRVGDRIIRIDRIVPENQDQIRRLLAGTRSRSGPALVELERGRRRFIVLLAPPA